MVVSTVPTREGFASVPKYTSYSVAADPPPLVHTSFAKAGTP